MATSLSDCSGNSSVSVALTAADIPGADLSKPLGCHAVRQRRFFFRVSVQKVPGTHS